MTLLAEWAWFGSVIVLAIGLLAGPLPIMVRGYLRIGGSPAFVRRWYRPVSLGLCVGLMLAVVTAGISDPALAIPAAMLCLIFLLASIDWQWRWLPLEWTVPLIVLGLIFGLQTGNFGAVALQMCGPAVVLLGVRQGVFWVTGKEALGLGDVWLVAGLAAFTTPVGIYFVIGFAGLSGLLEVAVRQVIQREGAQKLGVSYGTHLCIIFVIIQNFTGLS
ncbi:MAG: A24 family peptidase [Pseudomonadota bacterium]